MTHPIATPSVSWTEEDQAAALSEGWGIWTASYPNVRDGARLSEVQAWGEDPKEHFVQGDDETALMHVESRAAAGSALHRKAIMEITINGAYAADHAQHAMTVSA